MTLVRGKNVLITGGASGIGRRMAGEFAQLGARVILWDINSAKMDQTVQEIKKAGGEAQGYLCDVGNAETVSQIAESVQHDVGRVDVLVNNAGIVSGNEFLKLTETQIRKTFDINVLSLFWVTRAFLPRMVQDNSGHIVTIASAAGYVGVAKLSDYSASKWAAVGFDESLRAELKQFAPKVMTTVVCPYYIDTGMFKGVKTRFSFLLPILKEEKVAHAIVRAVLKNSRRLATPPMVHLVPLMRILPVFWLDFLANLFGINQSMKHFEGRQ
jgi:all-trans-retinol dehydrogenase (NAD+)